MSKKNNFEEQLAELRVKLFDINHGFEKNILYKKKQSAIHELESDMKAMREDYFKRHSTQINQVNDQIRAIEIKMRAKSNFAHDPKVHGSEFLTFWDKLFFGTDDYRIKELIWVNEEKKICLVKTPGHTKRGYYFEVCWYLIRVEDNFLLHTITGKMTWIKKAAMETKLGIKINL